MTALRERKPSTERVLLAISGIPGSGKTTFAEAVAERIAAQYKKNQTDGGKSVVVVPMDGFHLYRSQLAAMPNPEEAIHRRGAAFTFDAERFRQLVLSLREPLTDATTTIYAPSFDHALKDPVENNVAIPREAQIVVFEGLYLGLDREPWSSAARMMNELWFVDTDREVARQRLVKRHVASGIVPDEAAAKHRIESTDFLNADDIMKNRLPVDEYIRSE